MNGRLSDLSVSFKKRNGRLEPTPFPAEYSLTTDLGIRYKGAEKEIVPIRETSKPEENYLTGTWVNTGAILAGSLIGMTAGKHLPERLKTIVMQGLGLSVMLVGLRMAIPDQGSLAAIGCLLLGALTGELLRICLLYTSPSPRD